MRRNCSRSFVFAAISALLVCAPLRADDEWIVVRAGQFEVYSNAGARKAILYANEMQKMAAAVAATSTLPVVLPSPVRVFAFRNHTQFAQYAKPMFAGAKLAKVGVSITHGKDSYILIDASALTDMHVLRHELGHQFVNNSSRRQLPLWFSEGLAEFYANFMITREHAEVGRVPPPYRWGRRALANNLIPMREFLLADASSHWYTNKRDQQRYYAQAWAVVHLLMMERHDDGMRFLGLLMASRPLDDAFASAFRMTYLDFQRMLFVYLRRAILPTRRAPAEELRIIEPSEPASVAASDVAALLAPIKR